MFGWILIDLNQVVVRTNADQHLSPDAHRCLKRGVRRLEIDVMRQMVA